MTHSAKMAKLRREFARERSKLGTQCRRQVGGAFEKMVAILPSNSTATKLREFTPKGERSVPVGEAFQKPAAAPPTAAMKRPRREFTPERKRAEPVGEAFQKPAAAPPTAAMKRPRREFAAEKPTAALLAPAAYPNLQKRVHLPPQPAARSASPVAAAEHGESLKKGSLVLVRTPVGTVPTGQMLVLWLSAVVVSLTESECEVVYNGEFPRGAPFSTVMVPINHVKPAPPEANFSKSVSNAAAAVPRPGQKMPTT